MALPGDGWLRTGDLGTIDARGCLVLAGRTGEMFIRYGYNVYLMEVEAVLGQHSGVAEIAVVPRPDPVMGEVGVAAVAAVDLAAPPALVDLRAFARAAWPRTSCPTTWWRCPSSRSRRCRRSTGRPHRPR